MIHKLIRPSDHLKGFIKDYFILGFEFDKRETAPVKPFPAHIQESIVFYLKGLLTSELLHLTGESKAADLT
jgi:hypothetical protein